MEKQRSLYLFLLFNRFRFPICAQHAGGVLEERQESVGLQGLRLPPTRQAHESERNLLSGGGRAGFRLHVGLVLRR